MKQLLSFLPGFSSEKRWKKILSIFIHSFLAFIILIAMLTSPEGDFTSADLRIDKAVTLLFLLCFVLLPYILITNIAGLRSRLPLFRKKTITGAILGTVLSTVLVFTVFAVGFSVLDSFYSPQYKTYQAEKKSEEEKARQEARAKAAAEKEAKQKADLEAKQKAEAEKEIMKQAELDAKSKSEAEKAAKEQEQKQAESDAKSKAAAEKAEKQAEAAAKEQQKKQEEANKKAMTKFEEILKKHNTKEMLNLYNSSEDSIKAHMEDRIDTEYVNYVKGKKSDIIGKNITEINKIASELQFIDSIPAMKNKNIWSVYAYCKDIVTNNKALEDLKKQYPEAKDTGLIKDINDLLEVKCYVNYNIKSSGTKIGNVNINNEKYTDMYYISSYHYSEFTGYLPSDDWGAILKPRSSTIDKQGVYSFRVIQTGSESLTDSKGFKKEYPVYTEVTQNDIEVYNKNKDFFEKANTLNGMIDNCINRMNEYLK